MKYKNIFLTLFLVLLICLTIGSISAENITDDSFNNELMEINSCSDNLGIELETTDDAEDLSSSANQEVFSATNSDPLPNVETGSVSGGVDFTSVHPWGKSDSVNGNKGNISYDIPSTANIKSAYVYVNIYSGSGGTNYGAYANSSIITENGIQQLGSEYLWTSTSSTDGVNYIVNDHTTRCYSDYMIFYNVTDILQGLNGTSVSIDVLSYPMVGKNFDGRIKLVSLFVAWDDGDDDVINYWFNAGQAWTDDTVNGLTHSFNLSNINLSNKKSSLTNVAVSSADAVYKINNAPLFSESEDDVYISGAYYQYHLWDITNYVSGEELNFTFKAVGGAYGPSFKTIVSILTVYEPKANVSVSMADNNKNIIYPNLNNTLNVDINTNKAGRYVVNLLADGCIVNSTVVTLNNGLNSLSLIDPTIRPLNESAKYIGSSGVYDKVSYQVQVKYANEVINTTSYDVTVLYNGYLGKDTYNENSLESFFNTTVSGDIVVLTDGTYAGSSASYGSVNFEVVLPENSDIVKAFIYVPYCWASGGKDNIDMFNVTLNNNALAPVFFARDQSNLNSNSGYGVVVYDAENYLMDGNNVFSLNKTATAVYPTTLIYMYNTTGSNILKDIYISNGADLLGVSGGISHPMHVDSIINVDSSDSIDATAYIFGAGAKEGRATIVINGESDYNAWNTNLDNQINVYTKNIKDTVGDSNSISLILNNNMFLALQQIIVISKEVVNVNSSVKIADYTKNIVYPTFANALTVTVNTNRAGKYNINLLADGISVNCTEINLVNGENTLIIVDPTIRELNDSSKYVGSSGSYNKVNYQIQISFANELVDESSCEATVLYNGYLGKDTYNETSLESFFNITVNGDIVILTNGTYAGSSDSYDSINYSVVLPDKSSFVKAFIYVSYCWASGGKDNIDMFNVTLNNNALTPVFFARDQSNLNSNSGYGVVVYDVTDFIVNGDNVFDLNKAATAVYPTTLIYMYNTTGSNILKNIYISNGADLLGASGGTRNPIRADSTINVDASDIIDATAYIFANSAQDGEAIVVINGESESHPWNGSSQSTDLYTKDITSSIKDNNSISIMLNSGGLTVLQQIIVTTKNAPPISTKITVPSVAVVYSNNKNLVVTLKDIEGNVIANAKLTIVLNGKSKTVATNSNGKATFAILANLVPKTYTVKVTYDGNGTYLKSSASNKVVVSKATPRFTAKNSVAYTLKAVKKYTVVLKTNKGQIMKNAKVTIRVNCKNYIVKTNSKGQAIFKFTNLSKKRTYSAIVKYAGNTYYKPISKTIKVIVK